MPLDFILTVMMQPATYYIYERYILRKWDRLMGNEMGEIDETLEREGFTENLDT